MMVAIFQNISFDRQGTAPMPPYFHVSRGHSLRANTEPVGFFFWEIFCTFRCITKNISSPRGRYVIPFRNLQEMTVLERYGSWGRWDALLVGTGEASKHFGLPTSATAAVRTPSGCQRCLHFAGHIVVVIVQQIVYLIQHFAVHSVVLKADLSTEAPKGGAGPVYVRPAWHNLLHQRGGGVLCFALNKSHRNPCTTAM